MYKKNVHTFKNLPVEEKHRLWTDCCCTILTAIFALTLFILSFVLFQRNNYYKTNYPVDDNGKTCVYDYPDTSFIYFKNVNDITKDRQCVQRCPHINEDLKCSKDAGKACSEMGPSLYETIPIVNRLGAFCMPEDQTLRNKMWNSDQISDKYRLVNSYDIILLSLLIGVLVGLLYLVAVICAPKPMTYAVFVLAFIVLVIGGVLMFVRPTQLFQSGWSVIFGIILIVLGIGFLIYLGCYLRDIQLSSIFLYHSNVYLKETLPVFGYIVLFLILTVGLLVLFIWQYIAFGTANDPSHKKGDLFYQSKSNMVLQILNLIQFIWGIQFLRDAFNFAVTGNTVQWYFRNETNALAPNCFRPCSRLLCKNWGSVAGGSFLNAFFNIPDLISDFFRCQSRQSCGKCHNCYRKCCICDYVFELVRTDPYAYINLTGVPYCDAARQCESMCQYSKHFNSSQSCIRLYRMAAHIFLVGLVSLICYGILHSRANVSYIGLGIIILFSYCMVTYFIDIHSDSAQGIMVCYLVQQNCEGDQMFVCPPAIRSDIFKHDQKTANI